MPKTIFTFVGIKLAAISHDSVAVLKFFADRQKIDFPMLADTESKVIRDDHVLNTKAVGQSKGMAGRVISLSARKTSFGRREVAPECIERRSWPEQTLVVHFPKDLIATSPEYNPDVSVDRILDEEVYRHYGILYWE